jgi:Aspartyl protease
MPHLVYQLTQLGPVLDVLIAVSASRKDALEKASHSVPNPISIRVMVDTGASSTCIDPTVLRQLELSPTGVIPVHTPSTKNEPSNMNQFDVSLTLMHPNLGLTLHNIPVIESDLARQGIQGLLGRDVLASCLLVYDGQSGFFTLAF